MGDILYSIYLREKAILDQFCIMMNSFEIYLIIVYPHCYISDITFVFYSVFFPAEPVLGDVSPSFLIRKEGDSIDMFCEASSTPEPTLIWYKDGQELLPDEPDDQEPGGSGSSASRQQHIIVNYNRVTIRNLMRDDGGIYTCSFKNVVGQVSHIIKLVIEGRLVLLYMFRFSNSL